MIGELTEQFETIEIDMYMVILTAFYTIKKSIIFTYS